MCENGQHNRHLLNGGGELVAAARYDRGEAGRQARRQKRQIFVCVSRRDRTRREKMKLWEIGNKTDREREEKINIEGLKPENNLLLVTKPSVGRTYVYS